MQNVNVLFTSAGRRVSLVRSFRESIKQLGWNGRLITADLRQHAPAAQVSDHHILMPRVNDPDYTDRLLTICQDESVDLIVPLIDPELAVLAKHRERFQAAGTTVLVSSQAVADICFDKRATGAFFRSIGVDTPAELEPSSINRFPVFAKPARGSGGVGASILHSPSELAHVIQTIDDPIFQECITGTEYTIDVLVDHHGEARSVVPRQRLEVRSGEVSKGITRKNRKVIDAAVFVAEALPGAFGPVTLQCFHTADGRIVFIEINPRFGGGFPLSYAAGAQFPTWIMQWVKGEHPTIDLDEWEQNLMMLRYDDAFFVADGDSLL